MSNPAVNSPIALVAAKARTGKTAPLYVTCSAYAVPVLVLTGFGLLTIVPIAVLSYAALRDARVRPLRWWVGLTAGLFAIPFVGWLFRSNPETSLSSMLHPAMAGAIVLSSLVIIAKLAMRRRR